MSIATLSIRQGRRTYSLAEMGLSGDFQILVIAGKHYLALASAGGAAAGSGVQIQDENSPAAYIRLISLPGDIVTVTDGVATLRLDDRYVTLAGLEAAVAALDVDAATLAGESGTFYRARGNHTGTQLAATISDFATAAAAAAAVQSVAGRTGAVTLVAADVAGLSTVATTGSASDLSGTLALARIAQGPTGQVLLGVTGAAPQYGQVTDAHVASGAAIGWSKVSKAGSSLADLATRNASDLTGTLGVTHGGTGLTAFPAYSLPYASAANTLSALPGAVGALGSYLRSAGNGSVPTSLAWSPLLWDDTTGTADILPYFDSDGRSQGLSYNATINQVLIGRDVGLGTPHTPPSWGLLSADNLDPSFMLPVGQVSGLATVATTGSAADLTGTLAYARLPGAGGTWAAGGGTVALTGALTASLGLNVATGQTYKVGGVQVLRGRITGWGVPTGTLQRTTYATYTAPTISATYTQSEVQAIATALQAVSRVLGAVVADLHSTAGHGLFTT